MSDMRQLIAQLLTSEDPALRRRAAEDLTEASGFAAIAALAAALRDDNKGVRDAAVRALARIGNENVAYAVVEYLPDRNITTRNLAAELLMEIGMRSVPALLPALYDPDQDVRKFAVDIVGVIKAPQAVEHLVKLLEDPDPNVIVSSVEALGNIGEPLAVAPLIALYDERADSQAVIVESLGKIGGSRAAAFLQSRFVDTLATLSSDPVLMYTYLEALGSVGNAQTVSALREQVAHVTGKLRNILLHSMVQIAERNSVALTGVEKLKGPLLEALKDDDAAIRRSAAKALLQVEGDDVTEALAGVLGGDEELDALVAGALEGRPGVFATLVRLLEEDHLRPGKEVVGLISRSASLVRYADLPKEFLDAEANLLQRACRLLKNAWAETTQETRAAIVDALFRLDGDQAIEFLDAIMNDPDPWLRIHTIELLVPLDDLRIPQFISRFLQDDDEMVREVAISALESKGFTVGDAELQ